MLDTGSATGPAQSLSDSWNELYFLFHTRRVFGIYPFTNLEGLLSILGEGKLALDGVAQSPFLLGVRRKYEYVENMLAILQDRVEGIQRCQVAPCFPDPARSKSAYCAKTPSLLS